MSEEQPKTATGVPFEKGDPRINRDGRPPETPEQKATKKALREYVDEYRQRLAEALPQIDPVLIAKAIGGDVQAIKEINDRTMGKAPQSIDHTTGGDKIAPIYGNQSLQGHDSDQEDIQPQEENKGGSGGNGSLKDNLDTDLANWLRPKHQEQDINCRGWIIPTP